MLTTVALAAGVFAGALTQRITGMGFAIVGAPLLVLVAGPFQGVVLANLLGLLSSVALLSVWWRDVDWRNGTRLAVPSVVGVVPGAVAARILPSALLQVAVGLLVTAALLAAIIAVRRRPQGQAPVSGTAAITTAGACAGFMNATAGVGGPALTVYALRSDWGQRTFAATIQLCSAVMCAASLAIKGLPVLPAAKLIAVVGALVVGIAAGQQISRRIPTAAARRVVVLLALTGSAATVLKGVLTW